jgi:Ca-activated chloride channel family protein
VRSVSFTWPLALLALLLVPLVVAATWWLDRRRARYTVAFTNLAVLAEVVPSRQRSRAWVPLLLFLLALACASVALARPRAVVSRPAQQATVVLLVDVSGSMRAADVKPTRLGAAQRAMTTFLSKLPKKFKVGLVSFSTEPNVLVAPTTDRALLQEGIDSLLPESGTAIGDGLAVAVSVTRAGVGPTAKRGKDGLLPAAIVLLSDGAQTRGTLQPLQGADLAKRAGIPVFTIALGTNHGTLTFDRNGGGFFNQNTFPGFRFNVRPDPTTLRAIARDTRGEAFTAKSAARVEEIYKGLGSHLVQKKSKREVSSWFAGGAALLLLASLGVARLTAEPLP